MNLRVKQGSGAMKVALLDTEQLQAMTNLGRNNAMKFGEEAKAKVKVGRRVLWSRTKIEKYIRELEAE